MAAAATRFFVKMAHGTVNEAQATINTKYEIGDTRGLEALAKMYGKWACTSGNGNIWAWLAEYATAAAMLSGEGTKALAHQTLPGRNETSSERDARLATEQQAAIKDALIKSGRAYFFI